MSRFVPPSRGGKGRLALTLSLAMHGALGALLALVTARAGKGTAASTAPVVVRLVEEEGEEAGANPVPAPAARKPEPQTPAGQAAPRQVAMTTSAEDIVPVAHAVAAPPGGADATSPLEGSAAGPGQSGPPSFFQIGTQAERIVYVIDRSGSMGRQGLLDAAVRELLASLAHLPPTVRFQIVVYHDLAELLLPERGELLAASAENKERVGAALAALRAEGGTRHLPAVTRALTLDPQVIYLLTDADDLTQEEQREITRRNRGRAVIHTIELNTANRGRPDMPLQVLARANGGRYRAVEPR